ncbi:MAG: 3-dehydroquinate synthase [Nitrospirae bacterium]|nr:3-dehydroquinate synthase [Nitrospirota bacterium]
MNKIRVELGERSYTIATGSGILKDLGKSLERFDFSKKAAIVSNPTVYDLYGKALAASLTGSGFEIIEIILPDGEEYKNLLSVERIYEQLLRMRFDRRSVVIALGGGVIGDIAGYAASTYMRGIDFIQVPTTLLAQVDSSVGGKTGVNHALGKNMIGTFWQPRLVWVDISTLHTLSRRNFLAGMAEIIKYGIIWDSTFFDFLEKKRETLLSLNPDDLIHIIRRSCEIKADVVSRDERESGLRAILNFGHTIGHAIETATGYTTFLHGEAVGIGMHVEAMIAHEVGLISSEEVSRIQHLIKIFGLPTEIPAGIDLSAFFDAMKLDKKTVSGDVKFILPEQIGRVKIQGNIPGKAVQQAVQKTLSVS